MDPAPEHVARRGRAASYNPPNPFEPLHVIEDPGEIDPEDLRQIETRFFKDASKSILSRNNSPDVGFDFSINPYRGCEHGCIYCYARPTHEFLGFSAGIDFETRILVKEDAPELLARAFDKPSWQPSPVCLSGNTDPYQPAERRLKLTRRCLQTFLNYRNPVLIITKNYLVTRDLDILTQLAEQQLVVATISITSLDNSLIGAMEPRTSRPAARLKAVKILADAGVPVGVNIAPLIPGLTDEEMPAIIEQAALNGASFVNYLVVRLPGQVENLFVDWIDRKYPDRSSRILNRIKQLRSGSLSESRFKIRHRGEGQWADILDDLFHIELKKHGLIRQPPELRTDLFRRSSRGQTSLFDS